VLPGLVLLGLIVCAVFPGFIAPHSPREQDLRARNTPPAWTAEGTSRYLLGADQVGRDILSRIVHGARVSMAVAGVALSSGLVVGVTLGLLAGWYGGIVDEIVARGVDIWYALPFLVLAMVVVAIFGSSLVVMMVVLALVAWVGFVRNVRAEVFVLREMDYIQAARICGASTARIMIRHILPGLVPTVAVIATLNVGGLILTEATLSFLGIGIPPPTPSWGLMVADGRDYLTMAWWVSLFPGVAIFLVVMSLNFIGDWLRDFLDPRLRQQAQ